MTRTGAIKNLFDAPVRVIRVIRGSEFGYGFPLVDRNPQKYVENMFAAKESDNQTATQCVYRSPGLSSYIVMPVAK